MKYGICNLSTIPLRVISDHTSEMISQLLFGDHYKVLQENKEWLRIRLEFDNCEGWIENKQHTEISKDYFDDLNNSDTVITTELVDFIEDEKHELTSVLLGSRLPFYGEKSFNLNDEKYTFEGRVSFKKQSKQSIVNSVFLYTNAPFLWGGKTPFGIDSSGFTQMVYKLNGYSLLRKASEQATQGEVLSFIEESEPGDLAFFDDNEGEIIHVGIILANHHIIHCSGKVRIDMLDHSGIYNKDLRKHTHKLRVIKKIF
ncbi:C40 family peptidase [Aureibaculum sp. 2210JD6-5]|uniref:C40 family peptidase n=1 Tax=Aureibaculum sp. 2210JD6-5 TaxID=3103957 RepID=UPI002AAEFC0C|nr:C40 family peptidase [Aureibaculum sp. 2210JD6-5]MDY7396622.1 C40 family peptidase [Aureibaculum sp. 2210JD6-5]